MSNNLQSKFDEIKSKIENLNEPEKSILADIVEILETLIKENTTHPKNVKELSSFEFIKQKKLESHGDIVVGIAYYLYKYKGVDPFNVKDIERMYKEARLILPRNLNDIIAKQAKNKGYFIECSEKKDGLKAWKISARGIEYIESLPPKNE